MEKYRQEMAMTGIRKESSREAESQLGQRLPDTSHDRIEATSSIPATLSGAFEHEPLASFLKTLTSTEHFMFSHCKSS